MYMFIHKSYAYTYYTVYVKMGNLNFRKDGGDVINILTQHILQVD